ncbi:MAG: DUF3800 domain-containing protein [Methanoregula sp.]|nr:DUF3800 domain-containing protein [Methanoregula sp.]
MYSLSDYWHSHSTGNSIPGSLTYNSPLMSFLEMEDRGAKVIDRLSSDQRMDLASISIEIEHADSKNESCIQAADFIAGALHYYYRTNDDTFSGIINEKVALAFDYFKGPQK